MAKLYNLARVTTATTGTGTITLGSAVAGFLSFAGAGVGDGETVTYAIKDGSNSEIGRGVYTTSGTTLTRTVLKSTNSNNAISLSGSAVVFITAAAEDFAKLNNTLGAFTVALAAGTNVTANRTLTITTGDANRTLDLSAGSATISAYGATLIDDADAATARATLSVREVLTANRTYYVRTDGSDSNTGLVDSAGGAFLTIQKAIGTLYAIDLNGYNVTISLGTSVGGAISASGRFIGKGTITINGADSTAANHVLTSVYCSSGSALTFSHVQFTNPSWRALEVYSGAVVKLSTGCDFGAASNAQITVDGAGSQLYIAETYTISGGGTRHYNVINNGYAVKEAGASYTITVSGTPAFSGQFAYTEAGGIISLYNTTFSGAATGQRHYVGMLSSINTFGGGASFFPGNSAGTVDAANFGVFA